MISLVSGLLAVIFALISLAAHFWTKSQQTTLQVENQAVKDQISTNDAKIQANQQSAAEIAAQTAQKEQNETNQQILDGINSSNTPKS